MHKKLTITVSEEVYKGLHAKIGQGRISRFLDHLARPHVVDDELAASYQELAKEAERDEEADEWTANLASDGLDEAR